MAASIFGKRSTRFRHVYGSPAQKENCYDNIRVSGNAHDSMFCAVNRHFLAVVLECAGGGGFAVLPLNRTGRIDHNAPKVCGHSAAVMDVKWNPFNEYVVASASDDATVKLWEIPKTGIRSDLTRFTMDLRGHSRRVAYIEWHPTAENILLSAGFDHQSVLWNCEIGQPVLTCNAHPDVILSLSWNRDGSLYATTCKDRTARVIDPRSGKPVVSWEPHHGNKTTKICFLGDTRQLFTTGFSQFAQRQYGLWDMRSLTQGALKQDNVDSSSGALFPFYDHDTRMVYLAGKGDGNIRYFELTASDPLVHYLSEFQSPHPQRGLGVMPKLGLDTSRCEIFRFYKLHSNRPFCEPISMIAPRKAETFQEDLYPPTAGTQPALSAIEWIGGANRDPVLMSLKDPGAIVSSPPMTTSKPVRLPSHSSDTISNGQPANNVNSSDVEDVGLPQSVRNIRKLVGGTGSEAVSGEPKRENGHERQNLPPLHQPSSSSQYFSANAELHNGSLPHNRHSHEDPRKLAAGQSEQSLHSRGSDSVFERSSLRKSDQPDRPPSPVAMLFEHSKGGKLEQNGTTDISGSKRSLTERAAADEKGDAGSTAKQANEEKRSVNGTDELQPHPPSQPPHHHHLRHTDDHSLPQQSLASAQVSSPPGELPLHKPGGAFRPVVSSRYPVPPLSLLLPHEKPVSSGYVVQTAVQSPLSPTSRLPTSSHMQEVAQSQKVIQKLPHTNAVMDSQQVIAAAEHPSTTANDVPLASPQFRRGATGGNAYQPQYQQQQQLQPSGNGNGIVRSPSGRATRPDILDALQEQLSASSRELRTANNPTHQAVVYSKGPVHQGGHLQVGPVRDVATTGRSSRNTMSPADKRLRNRTVAGTEGHHTYMPAGDFAVSPGSSFAPPQRQMQLQNQPMPVAYYPIQAPFQQAPRTKGGTGSRRQAPPVPSRSSSKAPLSAAAVSPRNQNVAVVDVRDDMAPSMMRTGQQVVSPSGLNRSQTMYIPVVDSGHGSSSSIKAGESAFSPVLNGASVLANPPQPPPVQQPPGLFPNGIADDLVRSRAREHDRRHKRESSAAAAISRHHHHHHQPKQPNFVQKRGDDSVDSMSDADLRSHVRQQHDEIQALKRQCQAKDQVIHRLESELRHLVHQMQQRYGGVIGGAGAQALTAVGP